MASLAKITLIGNLGGDQETRYTPQGTLVSRRLPGAVLHDPVEIASRCVAMATGQPYPES